MLLIEKDRRTKAKGTLSLCSGYRCIALSKISHEASLYESSTIEKCAQKGKVSWHHKAGHQAVQASSESAYSGQLRQ